MISQHQIVEMLTYDPSSGEFRWKEGYGKRNSGRVAGCIQTHGYRHIRILGRAYGAHRLAWLYVHGHMPTNNIDHINGIRSDNRIANLRPCTQAQNVQNAMLRKSKLGIRGVIQKNGRFVAQISRNGRIVTLGRFDTPYAAQQAYLEAKAIYHPFQPVPRELMP